MEKDLTLSEKEKRDLGYHVIDPMVDHFNTLSQCALYADAKLRTVVSV